MAALVLSAVGSNLASNIAWSFVSAEFGSLGFISAAEALGGAVGSMIGSAIDQRILGGGGQNLQGPRLTELSVQSSADGAPLPVVYGTVRLAGNVVWSTGLAETAHRKKQGGGSGGGGSYTTYSYSTDVAVALCEGEILGVRRIWADTKLIYDIGTGASVATLVASSARAAGIRIYTGSETQQPDPLIQAAVGVANAPAFRGTAYVVFEGLQLADFGNRLPNFSFEVVRTGTASSWADRYLGTLPSGYGNWSNATYSDSSGVYAWQVRTWNISPTPSVVDVYLFPWGSSTPVLVKTISCDLAYPINTWVEMCPGYADTNTLGVPVPTSPYGLQLINFDGGVTALRPSAATDKAYAWCVHGNECVFSTGSGASAMLWLADLVTSAVVSLALPWTVSNICNWVGFSSAYIYASFEDSGSGSSHILRYDRTTLALVDDVASTTWLTASALYSFQVKITDDDWIYYSTASGYLTRYHVPTGTRETLGYENGMGQISPSGSQYKWTVHIDSSGQVFALWLSHYNAPATYNLGVFSANTLPQGTMDLQTVCEDLAARAGLSAAQTEAAQLASDVVRGYVVSRPMSMRAAIEPLAQSYFFDLAEQDGKIVAIKRGGASARRLVNDDLGVAESPDGDLVVLKRAQEVELPSEIQVTYLDIDNDFQVAMQYARRLPVEHQNVQQVQLPIVLTSQEAAAIADIALKAAWYARHGITFKTHFEGLPLNPTDVIDVPAFGYQLSARITGIEAGAPGIVAVSAVPDLAALYTSVVGAADPTGIGQDVSAYGATKAAIMDCALLQDVDNSLGWYVAATGYTSGWGGGAIYATPDNGATWGIGITVPSSAAATIGYATTQLGSADCRVWDKANTFTVRLYAGETLSSTTELAVLNGANAFALGNPSTGWEICQFKTATLNGDGTYTLSELLRGRKGTDWMAGLHQAGDVFVLLESAAIQWLSAVATDINATKLFKAVGNGQALESVSSDSLVYKGERSRCLSGCLLGGGRDGSSHIQFFWTRRTRVGGDWLDYSDAPVGETSEAYEAEVYDGAGYTTVKRTFTGLTTPYVVYSASQQTTDFGAPQSTIYVRVYQISATTGRGRVLQGSI